VAQRGVAGVVAALGERGFSRVTASTAVDNLVSQQVLVAAGFVEVGRRVDAEGGALVMWERSGVVQFRLT
jgi:RimJ/RimL family protein N-acetyltransferase